ncbi:PAS domain S-box protein [Polaromonas eurypsychrophila]|nr:PAS domain S-box protein [Polaromonas eurypsychrophila]
MRPVPLETIVAAVHEVNAMPHAAPQPKAMQEAEVLKEYSERLVSKLEEKNTELQAKIEALTAEIANRKRAEDRYHALFDFAPDAVVMIDQQGIISLLNRQAEAMFGYQRDELLGQPVEVLMPKAFRRAHVDLRQGFLGNAMPRAMGVGRADFLGLRKDGTAFPVDISLSPMESEGGIVVAAAVRDITERLQSEAALREREARLRAIIDNEPECVKLVDKNGLSLEMNPAGLRMIEADSFLQVQNEGINSAIVEEHRPAFSALLRKTLQGESGTLELDIIGLKGTRRTIDTHAVPLRDERGEVTALLGITRDITEQKRAEALLNGKRRALEMIAAGAPLGESLTAVVRLIEAQAPGMLGSILLLDEDGVHLRVGAAPSLPPEYVAAIDGVSIGPSAGSCGTAAYSKETVMVEDIATDPRWAEDKAVAL